MSLERSIGFTPKFQAGALALLLTDMDFASSVIESLEPSYFDAGEIYIKFLRFVKTLYVKYQSVGLTADMFRNIISRLQASGSLTDGDANGLLTILDLGVQLTPGDKDFIKTNVFEFIKKQTIACAFSDAIESFEKQDYDKVYSVMTGAFNKTYGLENSLGESYLDMSVHDRYSVPPRQGIWPTRFERLNKYIGGGIAQKECCSVVSSTGRGKCLGRGTPVLMYDGTIKEVQNIKVNDLLMGPDGTSRRVLSLGQGVAPLYKITPVKGMPYIVNDAHILSLRLTPGSGPIRLADGELLTSTNAGEVVFVTAETLYKSSKTAKHCLKGWRPEAVVFNRFPSTVLPIPAYILGVWLGDGTSSRAEITQLNNTVLEEFRAFASSDSSYKELTEKNNPNCIRASVTMRGTFGAGLHALNLLNNKHIPDQYKFGSIETRRELLAGLLDTDGHLHYNNYDIVQKRKALAEDIAFIARSLGFLATISKCTKGIKSTGFMGTYYRVSICGDCDTLPLRLKYKNATTRKQKKNPLVTGVQIHPYGTGEYFGFEIDGDRQFLLGDWQVTHNTALLCNLAVDAMYAGKRVAFITLEMAQRVIEQRVDAIISGWSPAELASYPEARVELEQLLLRRPPGGYLQVKEFPRGTLTPGQLTTYLDRLILSLGKIDVVIVDWLGCMKLPKTGSGEAKRYEVMAEIADELVNMSRRYEVSMLTAHQTNRSGTSQDVFSYGAVSESFSSLFGLDLVLGLGASDKAVDSGKRTLTILKSRLGPDSVFTKLAGNRPDEPINYRFTEMADDEAESEAVSGSVHED